MAFSTPPKSILLLSILLYPLTASVAMFAQEDRVFRVPHVLKQPPSVISTTMSPTGQKQEIYGLKIQLPAGKPEDKTECGEHRLAFRIDHNFYGDVEAPATPRVVVAVDDASGRSLDRDVKYHGHTIDSSLWDSKLQLASQATYVVDAMRHHLSVADHPSGLVSFGITYKDRKFGILPASIELVPAGGEMVLEPAISPAEAAADSLLVRIAKALASQDVDSILDSFAPSVVTRQALKRGEKHPDKLRILAKAFREAKLDSRGDNYRLYKAPLDVADKTIEIEIKLVRISDSDAGEWIVARF